jgi:hypothetical protein
MNFLGILIAAIAGMGIGFAWYGPLFGKKWIQLSGITPEQMAEAQKKGMRKTYIIAFLVTLLMAYVLGIMVSDFASGMGSALRVGVLGWLALIVPTGLNSVLWGGRPKQLFWLDASERLVTILVMCAILALI